MHNLNEQVKWSDYHGALILTNILRWSLSKRYSSVLALNFLWWARGSVTRLILNCFKLKHFFQVVYNFEVFTRHVLKYFRRQKALPRRKCWLYLKETLLSPPVLKWDSLLSGSLAFTTEWHLPSHLVPKAYGHHSNVECLHSRYLLEDSIINCLSPSSIQRLS